ncbi:hypothetical protein [Actinacidiphila oryziradicis]|uniref:hypothetical protein n=1 Tax=Actinacidiphila oryziradicis TaxID=2571141 RepID=UPI00145DF6F0|nr:hypothetical protein [Actinacidiphila oryziradicis]
MGDEDEVNTSAQAVQGPGVAGARAGAEFEDPAAGRDGGAASSRPVSGSHEYPRPWSAAHRWACATMGGTSMWPTSFTG